MHGEYMSEKLRKRYEVLSLKKISLINQLKALLLQRKNARVGKKPITRKIKKVRLILKKIDKELLVLSVFLKKGVTKQGTFVKTIKRADAPVMFKESSKGEFTPSSSAPEFQATMPIISASPLPNANLFPVRSTPLVSPVSTPASNEEIFVEEEEIYVPPSDELEIIDDLDENLQDKVMAFYEENKLMILAGAGLLGAYLLLGKKKKRSNPKRKKRKSKRSNRRRSGYHRH
jgi:hypothetical protein